ncbi:7811_t:CDS:2 [Paraglomus occultum]|uniref:7811_t:CDS:1 n=1 Tax=Paraglomus occultum TaxID=144539 RepID=A0A9N8WQ31_9GLOM|nr:7811_t:CDS:2 [Paraglomus occultum]
MSIIDQLIEYLNPKPTLLRFKSISYSEFTDVKHIEHLTDTIVHYAKYERRFIVLIFLGDSAVRKTRGEDRFGWVDFNTLHDIHEIGCGGYGVALRARWSKPFKPRSDSTPIYVVLKSLNNFDTMKDTFFYEVKHFAKSLALAFLPLYGITQQPETGTYMMPYMEHESGIFDKYRRKSEVNP